MAHAPRPQSFKHGAKRAAMRRQPISHAEGWFLVNRPRDESVRLQLPQVLTQYLNGHPRHASSEVAKSQRAFAEASKDHGLPTAFDYAERGIDRTPGTFVIAGSLLGHAKTPCEGQGTSKCLIAKALDRT
jgi:hypothetical protein